MILDIVNVVLCWYDGFDQPIEEINTRDETNQNEPEPHDDKYLLVEEVDRQYALYSVRMNVSQLPHLRKKYKILMGIVWRKYVYKFCLLLVCPKYIRRNSCWKA